MKKRIPSAIVFATIVLTVGALGSGCSSSSSDPECVVDGTYAVTGALENGDCPVSSDPITDTFTTLPSGEVELQIQSLPDLVPVGKMNGCTWTAAGAVIITDAVDPTNAKGTLQYSYTFTRTGLSGTVASYFPPAKSLPAGCRGTTKVTGTKH